MKVTLVDYTGKGHSDKWYAAKKLIIVKNTRISKDRDFAAEVEAMSEDELMAELKAVSMSIKSSHEFVNFTFKIEGISRAACDQIVRSRVGVSFAVMAQRVVDNSNFKYITPETVTSSNMKDVFDAHMAYVAQFYRDMVKAGIPTQDARSVLPMATESPLTAEYNLRSLSDIMGKRTSLRAQGEYIEVAREAARQVIAVMPWTEMFLFPERAKTPNIDAILKGMLGDRSPVENKQLNDALKELDALKGIW